MALLTVICTFMVFGPLVTIAAPSQKEDTNTFYSALYVSCSNATELLTKHKEIFVNCKNFETINQTTTLSPDNIQNVLCLFYYYNLKSYCQSKPKKMDYPTLTEVTSKNYDLVTLCKNIVKDSKLINTGSCIHICGDWQGVIKPECQWAHYYNTILQNKSIALHVIPSTPNENSAPPKSLLANNPPNPEEKNDHLKVGNLTKELKPPPPHQLQDVESQQSNIQTSLKNPAPVENKPVLKNVQSSAEATKEKNTEPANTDTIKNLNQPKQIQNVAGQGQEQNETPTETKDDKIPTESKDDKTPTETKDDKTPTETKDDKTPTETKDDKTPTETKDDKTPTETKDDKTPTETKDDKTPKADESPSEIIETPKKLEDEPKPKENDPKFVNIDGMEGGEGPEDYNSLAEGETPEENVPPQKIIEEEEKPKTLEKKPDTLAENPMNDEIEGESYFMSYFMIVCVLIILGYVGYHNRIKVMALLLEGKRNKRQYRGRRPNSANYHKLDSNLEEAISSNVTKNANNVIY